MFTVEQKSRMEMKMAECISNAQSFPQKCQMRIQIANPAKGSWQHYYLQLLLGSLFLEVLGVLTSSHVSSFVQILTERVPF